MRQLLISLALSAGLALPAAAQDRAQTLADLRTELDQLSADLQSLRAELVASGAAGFAAAGGDTAIARMDAMEQRLMQLTGQTEELQNRISRVVKDGTNRIGDIEFRLCEMEEGCDLGALTGTPDLGGQGGGALPPSDQQGGLSIAPAQKPVSPAGTVATTAAEQADFDRAREVLGQGDFRQAAQLFAAIAQTHTGGPLTAEALFLQGAALDSAQDPEQAARAWLMAFAADPDGTRAPESLLGLSRVMAGLGHQEDACLFLVELTERFAQNDAAAEAQRRLLQQDCQFMDNE